MDPSFYYLAAAAGYGEARMAALSNNLANVNTPGFKADQMQFSEVLDAATGTVSLSADQYIDFAPGNVETTGNPLDLAIEGDGFFVVDTPDGQRFTRDGGFTLGPGSVLQTSSGHPVLGGSGPVTVDPAAVNINITQDGNVIVDGQLVNTIQVVSFPEGTKPIKAGGNLFFAEGSQPATETVITQGALERSNVQSVTEMARMIEVTRGYEAYVKVIQAMDATAAQTTEVGTV
ncbi:MAG: flagellar basal-body rod protein FlgF [Leptospirillia bacterium]